MQERRVIALRPGGADRHWMSVQRDQRVGRGQIQIRLVRAVAQRVGEAAVAEILQKQEAPLQIPLENLGCGQAQLAEPRGDPGEGADVLARRRRVHQHHGPAGRADPEIAPERGVGGQGGHRIGRSPAGGQKLGPRRRPGGVAHGHPAR